MSDKEYAVTFTFRIKAKNAHDACGQMARRLHEDGLQPFELVEGKEVTERYLLYERIDQMTRDRIDQMGLDYYQYPHVNDA